MATAPATTANLEEAKAYQNKLQSLLGNRDPVEVLSATAEVLARIMRRHSSAILRKRPFPGKWTPNEILGHLTDSEWVYGYRIRLILCQPTPTILGMDQELWVVGQGHNHREPQDLLDMFGALRGANLTLWKRIKEVELSRVGRHNERGDESLGMMLKMHAGHDLSHIDQITRYIDAAWKSERAPG